MSWQCPKCTYPNPDTQNACFKCQSTLSKIIYHPAPLSESERRVWETNVGLHRMPSQQDRQRRAAQVPLRASFVDEEAHVARIWDYVVTLQECSCPDFEHRGKPCKHMYRLAHELGFFALEADPATIRTQFPAKPRDKEENNNTDLLIIGGIALFVLLVLFLQCLTDAIKM